MSATATATTTKSPLTVNGLALLEACAFDRRLCAAIIAAQPIPKQEQLLASIPTEQQRRNVAAALAAIRLALGLEAEYAREIAQGGAK